MCVHDRVQPAAPRFGPVAADHVVVRTVGRSRWPRPFRSARRASGRVGVARPFVDQRLEVGRWRSSSRSTADRPCRTPSASNGWPSGSSQTRKEGHDVVVVVSAMGDTTDELIDLAEQVSPAPPPRELDMLLTAGERISNALLAMAIHALGAEARSFTGSQAGMITTSKHGDARIIDVNPGPHPSRAGRRRDRAGRRLPGRERGHQGDHHAGPGRLGHHRRRAGRRPEGRRLRDLHRRGRRLHRRPADRPGRPAAGRPSPTRRCSRWPPAAPRCCTCAPWSTPGATTCRCACARRTTTSPARSSSGSIEEIPVEQAIITGVAHDRSEAKITVTGVPDTPGHRGPDLPRGRRRRDQHRHGAAERLARQQPAHRHHLHAAPLGRPDGGRRAGSARKAEIGFDEVLYDEHVGKVSLVGAGMRSTPG